MVRYTFTQGDGNKAKLAPKYRSKGHVRTIYMDDSGWVELAQARGLILPHKAIACTNFTMKKWMDKLNFSLERYQEWTGFKNVKDWRLANKDWSLRSWVGMLLEELS